jgi:hypothetical protein
MTRRVVSACGAGPRSWAGDLRQGPGPTMDEVETFYFERKTPFLWTLHLRKTTYNSRAFSVVKLPSSLQLPATDITHHQHRHTIPGAFV